MQTQRIGQVIRAIRRHQRLTQQDVADRAGISQSVMSHAEHGDLVGMTVRSLERIAAALGAFVVIDLRYRGGLGDRLVDAVHAQMVDRVVRTLTTAGWSVELEFGFSVYGERGAVDILAWHVATRTLPIIEVKSQFTDLQAMLSSLSRKVRLVPGRAAEELGWQADSVGRLVVAEGSRENRSILARHAAIFDAVLPARAIEIRRWLRRPSGSIAGVWLLATQRARP